MKFSIAFLNCGKLSIDGEYGGSIASTISAAVGNDPHIVGLCEVYDQANVPKIVIDLGKKTNKKYDLLMSDAYPPSPRLGILIDKTLGRLQQVGDDEHFRHGKDWRHWLAGRVELFTPGTRVPSLQQIVVIANHWTSMSRGRQDTMSHREILAWEVGSWMCSTDKNSRQVLLDGSGHPVPVYRQPSIAMGDFNCEPGSHELRSNRKFTLQAMRNEPAFWKKVNFNQNTRALMYDLSWRKLTAAPASAVPGTYGVSEDIHSPAMLDRILVSEALWKGPDMQVALDGSNQAMRIIPAVKKCTDHSAVAITVETK